MMHEAESGQVPDPPPDAAPQPGPDPAPDPAPTPDAPDALVFPVMAGIADLADHLSVTFTYCDAGWVGFQVSPLAPDWDFRATHLSDPFADMIRWLEDIVAGARAATWAIDSEGTVDRLTFVAAHHGFDQTPGLLLHSCSRDDQLFRVSACMVDARAVVAGFYRAFTEWTDGDGYRPEQWEWRHADELEPDKDEDEMTTPEYEAWMALTEDPWRGDPLRAVRSAVVERWLAGVGDA